MAHSLACPKCRTKLLAPSEVFGETVRCTKCGTTFTASPNLSPYAEGLPRPPANRRPLLLAGAVAAGLVLITGLILGINFLNDVATPEPGTMASTQESEKARQSVKLKMKAEFKANADIEIPDDDGPDRVPPPGQGLPPALQKMLGKDDKPAAAKKATNAIDDVALTFIKWEVAPGVRTLQIGYAFQNGATPSGKPYVLKVKINHGPASEMPVNPKLDAAGIMEFRPETTISEGTPGRQPKVEAWIELTTGSIGQKVSNTISTE